MRFIPKWIDKVQDVEKTEQCIYDLCFNPDGSQLIVASGNRVLVYDTNDGTLIQPLRGHKESVYCVAYACNGERFASGAGDKSVIIWSNKLEGILKYNHSDAVQCMAFHPWDVSLISCSVSDFIFWSLEHKSTDKHKINARINCCSWSSDGQLVALGLVNGCVTLRNKSGEEVKNIQRPGNPVIWALSFSTTRGDQAGVLSVTDWNQTLSFYNTAGTQLGKERNIGFNALCLRYFMNGEYMLISGTEGMCSLYTKEGIKLGIVGDPQNGWLWCCDTDPTQSFIVTGCQDGTIAFYQLVFNTVHGLYMERYAFRENMTDVIIQHLLTEQKVRIKCRDLVKKIAIFKNRLAIQLPERVVIYELSTDDDNDMHYKVKEKITQKLDCSLLVVCTSHVLVCREMVLHSMNFSGKENLSWEFSSPIRYIKVVGGAPEQEVFALGLKNGEVWKVQLDNTTPLLLFTANEGVRCLDMSSEKEKLAVVDETGLCQVVLLSSGEVIFQEPEVNSVAWNSQFEDILAFSGEDYLTIKAVDFPAHLQQAQGFVVGLSGSKVFCLNGNEMTTLDIPLGAPMYQYLDSERYEEAYNIACLGITDRDWEELAVRSLEKLQFEIAKLAFIKLQDYNFLELIEELQEKEEKGDYNKDVMLADIYAYQGRFKEAAHLYQKAGNASKALAMYTDLRMFNLAQNYLNSTDNEELIHQRAAWAKNIHEYKVAVDMYLSSGDTQAAIDIMGEQGWTDQLIDLGKKLDRNNKSLLVSIAEHLKRLHKTGAAAEIYRRLGNTEAVINLYVEAKEWTLAFDLAENQPQYKALVYVPYARWLAENDKFVQAQKAFHKAGKPHEAFMVLEQLMENAVTESRFDDAGYYYWIMSHQCLELASENINEANDMLKKFVLNERLAGIYYAYNILHKYMEEPFTAFMPEALFTIARFVLTELNNLRPNGVSLFTVLYTFAKQARVLGANKLAKSLFDRIQNLRVPPKFQEQVEILTVASRARLPNDPEELLPMCYRCSTYNPLINCSDKCFNCGHKFVYSYISFEILPLVEFILEEGISDQEAINLIESSEETDGGGDGNKWKQEVADNHEALRLDDEVEEDPFTSKVISYESGDSSYAPVTVGRKTLLSMDSTNIFIQKWKPPLRFRYFRNLLPDLQITMCHSCFKAYYNDDFEHQLLQKGYCPFCREPPEDVIKLDDIDDLMESET